ncbi:hypothetical protein CLOM_g14571 [Closterium sp. NIES-68]|nr:hypothetical protein CLOM_g14571 [Closterium sp. NIES-68]
MPAYEVLVMAKAAVQRGELVDVVRGLAQRVIKDGGVVMAVKSYGTVRLAYDVKKRDGWHQQGQVVQVEVNAPASLAQQLEHLNKDERLLRWLLLKRRPKRWMTWRGEAMQSATMPPPQAMWPPPALPGAAAGFGARVPANAALGGGGGGGGGVAAPAADYAPGSRMAN